MFVRNQSVFLLAAVACLCSGRAAVAQPAVPNEPTVQLNFPQEVEIQVLIDYVSNRLGIKFLYDDQVRSKRISIKSPGQVPTSSVLAVLESALRMKGLVLADADAPGWKRIVQKWSRLQNNSETMCDQAGEATRKR